MDEGRGTKGGVECVQGACRGENMIRICSQTTVWSTISFLSHVSVKVKIYQPCAFVCVPISPTEYLCAHAL